MTPSACVMIRRCAGLLAARRLRAVRLHRARWAASRRNGPRHPRTSLLLPICPASGAIKWTRLSCPTFAANAVRLHLHALAYNLGNFLRTLATPEPIKDWSLTSLKEKLIKIGAKVVS